MEFYKNMNSEDKRNFFLTIFFGWSGIHKFIEKENIWGIVYIFTFGFFFIGWFYDIYTCIYYSQKEFIDIKNSIKENTQKCNDLNNHIEILKNSYVDIKQIDYGSSTYTDSSRWNYKRPANQKYRAATNVYNCSRTVCSNSRNQPFKYICKYFNINENEESLNQFENILNDFSAAEQGKQLLKNERDEIINGILDKIPALIKTFNKKKMIKKLGFENIDFSQLYFPRYTFSYISSGGNASMQSTTTFNLPTLDRFIVYLSQIVKYRKSVAGQRVLMTTTLREKIKQRDNYTCCSCGNSISKEPNLLLEIDHIIPLSKNGLTTENNLQTLCWKCNRSKGAKIVENR